MRIRCAAANVASKSARSWTRLPLAPFSCWNLKTVQILELKHKHAEEEQPRPWGGVPCTSNLHRVPSEDTAERWHVPSAPGRPGNPDDSKTLEKPERTQTSDLFARPLANSADWPFNLKLPRAAGTPAAAASLAAHVNTFMNANGAFRTQSCCVPKVKERRRHACST